MWKILSYLAILACTVKDVLFCDANDYANSTSRMMNVEDVDHFDIWSSMLEEWTIK